jgi:transcriptional regulator with XRE-family HTH domain
MPRPKNMPPKSRFGEWLYAARMEAGWSAAHLADRAGLSQSSISNYENGHKPKEDSIRAIAKALGRNIDEALRAALPQGDGLTVLSDEEKGILIIIRDLPPDKRRLGLTILDALREEKENPDFPG